MSIPDEVIEAAAEALVSSTLGDRAGIKWEEFFEAARLALNAAAPQLMADAWEEGRQAEEDAGQLTRHISNPYRKNAK